MAVPRAPIATNNGGAMTEEATEKVDASPKANTTKAGWRIKTGFALFIASIVWPVLLPILPLFGLSSGFVAAFSGVMLVAAEVMMVVGAAVAGKEGFAFIKQRIFGFIKSYGPPQEVSAVRYKTGLVIFSLPLLYAFLSPYIGKYLPGITDYRVVYGVVGDVLLLVSLLLLGGDFWEKLRALYIHKAAAVIPEKTELKIED